MAMSKTKESVLKELRDALTAQYEKELTGLPFQKKIRECLVNGFKSGVLAGIHHTVKMMEIEVEDDRNEKPKL